MSWSDVFAPAIARVPSMARAASVFGLLALAGCNFQPLYGSGQSSLSAYPLTAIEVEEADTRVGQQVRNHLIFLLRGGNAADPEPRYELRMRVRETNQVFAAEELVRTQTAGAVTITVSYSLYEAGNKERIAQGSRTAFASYDRTLQSFANNRAVVDAENRAAREVAEQIRLALAADLKG
jgi:LPS-assembly lipoprotein